MEPLLRQLVERLRNAHGEDLVSVILYGSAVEPGQHDPEFSDINVLCVLREVNSRQLQKSQPVFTWWRSYEKPVPLLLSERELRTSTDCFPIEFRDMQSRRRVLAGRDIVEGLPIDDRHYRAQVEYELRSKLLRLRQKAATVLAEKNLLYRLLAESVTTFCLLTRHVLLLHGVEAPTDRRAIVRLAQERFGIEADPFNRLLDAREKNGKLSGVEPGTFLDQYLKQIGIIIEAVDALSEQPAARGGGEA